MLHVTCNRKCYMLHDIVRPPCKQHLKPWTVSLSMKSHASSSLGDEHTLSSAKQKKPFENPSDKCLQDQDKQKLKHTNKPEIK